MKVSKRFVDRAKPALKKFQKLLADARSRDVNESDTCVILADFLSEVLGYDKYSEVTTEFAVRSTFCDLAIKTGNKVRFLIEVKSAGTELRDNHLNQAVSYAAQQGVDWVLLTNGIVWQAHRMKFDQPINSDLAFEIDLCNPACKPSDLLVKLYLISKEAVSASAIDAFWERREATSRYVVAQILFSAPALKLVRRTLRSQFKGVKVTEEEIAQLLRDEVIKRELLEGDKANSATRMLKRGARRAARAKEAEVASVPPPA